MDIRHNGAEASMYPEDEIGPAKSEIARQLTRLCSSFTLGSAPQLLKLLTRLVADPDVTEGVLAEQIFGRKGDWDPINDSIVRANMSNLRKELKTYYRTEGETDPVLIQFPPRHGYKATYAYNPRSLVALRYRRGLALVQTQAPHWVRAAQKEFDSALALQSDFAPAYAAQAEAFCTLAMYDFRTNAMQALPQALSSAEMALKLSPDLWHAHAALATAHLFTRRWDLAAESFHRSLQLNIDETQDYQWYGAYLLSRDNQEEALELMKARSRRFSLDPMRRSTYGLYLYLTERLEQAEVVTRQALDLDEHCWFAHFTLALIHLAHRPAEAQKALGRLHRVEKILSYEISPGLVSHCFTLIDNPQAHPIKGANYRRFIAEKPDEEVYVKHREFALSELAGGGAFRYLELACDDCDPFMIWGKLWPLFRSMRRPYYYARYKDLEKRMSVPFDPRNPTFGF